MIGLQEIEQDKKPWIPDWLEGPPDPPESKTAPDDRNVHVNLVPGEIEVADDETMRAEIARFGRVAEEPEIGRARELATLTGVSSTEYRPAPNYPLEELLSAEMRVGGYSDTYWTHFDYRADVAKEVVRLQKRFPWLTYMNTYYMHPPVYGRRYEFVSWDVWQGGTINGKYVGYRGKPLDPDLGARVFNAVFYDPYAPPIYWIIYRGRMWTRGYGWGPAPGGPPDSDPGHWQHIHKSSLLVY